MFCVKSESWDMWPVCEVTCKIQINSDNSLSSVTQHSCQSRNLLSRPENDIHTPGMVRPCWYFCSGLSGKCHGPLNIARGSHDSSDPAAHSFRWRWPDKVLIMPSHMRYHSRQGQWSPCIKGFELELSFLVGRLERIFFQREMPLTCDEKQRNTFRLIDGHMLWNSRMFLPPMMMDGDDCLSVFNKYSFTRGSGDVNELPRIFLFLKTREKWELTWDFLDTCSILLLEVDLNVDGRLSICCKISLFN